MNPKSLSSGTLRTATAAFSVLAALLPTLPALPQTKAASPPSLTDARRSPVVAVGNPFGLSNTVTVGIVSAVRRTVGSETSVAAGSPADRKGLERGDRVYGMNGITISTLDDLNHALEAGFGRRSLVMVVVRGGYGYTVTFGLE